jgi:CRP-like cAMP-binding protein
MGAGPYQKGGLARESVACYAVSETVRVARRQPRRQRLQPPRVRLLSFNDGAVIYTAEAAADRFLLVKTGRVRLLASRRPEEARTRRPTGGGRRREHTVVAVLGPGDLFGAVAPGLVAMGEDAVAAGVTHVLSVPVREVRELIEGQPDLAVDLIAALGERLHRLRRRVEMLSARDVRARVAQTLLDLAERHGVPCPRDGELDLRGITHRDISDLVGARRTHVSTRLGEMRGLVVTEPGGLCICLRDLAGLRALARGR